MEDEASIDLHYLEPKVEIEQEDSEGTIVLQNTLNINGKVSFFDQVLATQECYLCKTNFPDWTSLKEHTEKDHIGEAYDVTHHLKDYSKHRTFEQEKDRERQRIRRLNPEYRTLEQEKNRQRQRLRRQDPNYRTIEKEKNRQRQRIRRLDPEYRTIEKEKNKVRQRLKRQGPQKNKLLVDKDKITSDNNSVKETPSRENVQNSDYKINNDGLCFRPVINREGNVWKNEETLVVDLMHPNLSK